MPRGSAHPLGYSSVTPAENVIPRLEGVLDRGNRRYLALCPSHPDKSPSLSLLVCDDEVLLLKCWAGCSAQSVMQAIGLGLADLFPNRKTDRTRLNNHGRIPYRDALALIMRESMVVLIAADDTLRGIALSSGDFERLGDAIGRIRTVCTAAGVAHGDY